MRLPPRPHSAVIASASTMAAAAAAAIHPSQQRRRRRIPAVDSCGNLLDPGLVAFAEVGFYFMSPTRYDFRGLE